MINQHVPFFSSFFTESIDLESVDISRELISGLKDTDNGNTRSNQGGWHSEDFTSDTLWSGPMVKAVTEAIIPVYTSMGIIKEPKLQGFWVNINTPGDYNLSHSHPGSYLSACLFIDVPKDSGSFVFERTDNLLDFISASVMNPNNFGDWKIDPSNGDLVIFPSNMKHYVERNNSTRDRISIAFNFA